MKYAQLIIGLLAGTALGGAVVASTGAPLGSTATGGSTSTLDKEAVKQIVRDTIAEEPKLILESVQKYQQGAQDAKAKSAGEALKDKDVHAAVFTTPNTAFAGNEHGSKIIVEFFDYNCPACKMMWSGLDSVIKGNKDVKVIFKEFPIFGPSSDANSKIGLAVWHLYPDRYFEFHEKMMAKPGHGESKVTYEVIKDMGLDKAKIDEDAKNPDYAKMIEDNRKVAEKLNIQGTPTLVIGEELVPHALSPDELKSKVDALK